MSPTPNTATTPPPDSGRPNYSQGVPAVAQASQILFYLAGAGRSQQTLTEICREVGIHKSKGYAILNTLMESALVVRSEGAKTYALGDTEVLLFLLLVTSEEIAVEDVDTLKRDLVKGSRDYPGAWGPKLVQEVRTWLADKVNDFSVRAIWIDERAARKG